MKVAKSEPGKIGKRTLKRLEHLGLSFLEDPEDDY
jgi:hypothetical protein